MNNNYLLTLASSVIPILAIAFVGVMLLCRIYIKIRSKFNTTVNCWFCNQNARVPYLEYNSWTCPHCEQYNGFTKDGDYNREIFQQRDCSNLSAGAEYSDHSSELYMRASLPPRNGFCDGCNEAQRLKVEKLAQFEPKNESHFDAELKTHKQQLEEQYRLCSTCDRHLNKVLHEKKKMVLGSKFLAYIIKGAETLKQPHFNQIRFARQQQWKQRLTQWTTVLIVINICCLISVLPALTSKSFINVFGASLGSQIFIAFSHILAFGKVLYAYLEKVLTHPNVLKLGLFVRTLMLMLLYSLGLKWPQIGNLNLSNLYTLACPFAMLSLAFTYNIVDSFKLTRFTFLLAVWSAFAGGIVNMDLLISKDFALLVASFVTLILCSTCKNKINSKLHDNTANSFHKIYSDDYLSDDDTLSLLSQHFNCSSTSMRSSSSNHSYQAASPKRMQTLNSHLGKIPRTSSVLSLNNLPTRSQLSPTSSFKSFCIDDNQTLRPQYAASMCNFPINAMPRSPIFPSNQAQNSRGPLRTSAFGLNANALNGSFHNSTLSNASFLEPNVFPLRSQQQQQTERFFNSNEYPPISTSGRNMFVNQSVDISLASPFSVSSSAVHQQRSNNLLTPSRFSNTCLASNASASSWLSGGYFNQRNQTDTTKRGQYLLEHRNGLTTIDENISRASSHSSGFESQNGRVNLSRENSLCPDSADLMQRTVCLDNVKGFQPIESSYGGGGISTLSSRPSLLSQKSHYSQPLTVNCSTAAIREPVENDIWPRAPALRTGNGFGGGRDSFNLRKINEELPTIRRGDLLKKWKQGQPLS